eukprot:m.72262 g.72262  ORF g.72262 m.72262 type:complete len:68 (-) comp20232_c0_seq2:2840-3043(-)
MERREGVCLCVSKVSVCIWCLDKKTHLIKTDAFPSNMFDQNNQRDGVIIVYRFDNSIDQLFSCGRVL